MKNKELYIDPEFEMILYSIEDVIHTSVVTVPAVTDEGEIDIGGGDGGDIFDDENVNIDDDDFFD